MLNGDTTGCNIEAHIVLSVVDKSIYNFVRNIVNCVKLRRLEERPPNTIIKWKFYPFWFAVMLHEYAQSDFKPRSCHNSNVELITHFRAYQNIGWARIYG